MIVDIGTLLPAHARYRPDFPALHVGGIEYTFAELNREVNRLANALLAAGLVKGDKVSTVMTNRLELVLMYWAAAKTGIVIVPVSTLLQDTNSLIAKTPGERPSSTASHSHRGVTPECHPCKTT